MEPAHRHLCLVVGGEEGGDRAEKGDSRLNSAVLRAQLQLVLVLGQCVKLTLITDGCDLTK